MAAFSTVWDGIQSGLHRGTVLKNWTAFKGYLGDTMKVDCVETNSIVIDSPGAKNLQVVPRREFKKVWQVWSGYKSLKVNRYELRDMTRFSKYIISIFQWYEQER